MICAAPRRLLILITEANWVELAPMMGAIVAAAALPHMELLTPTNVTNFISILRNNFPTNNATINPPRMPLITKNNNPVFSIDILGKNTVAPNIIILSSRMYFSQSLPPGMYQFDRGKRFLKVIPRRRANKSWSKPTNRCMEEIVFTNVPMKRQSKMPGRYLKFFSILKNAWSMASSFVMEI